MNSMESKKTKIEDVIVDKTKGRVLVSVSLSPRVGREKTVRISAADVRNWLISEKKIKADGLISGVSIHNNMSRRLGAHRGIEDLSSIFVFALEQEAPKKATKKATVKKTTTKASTTAAAKPVADTKPAPTVKAEKKTTTRRRASTTSRRKTTTVKKGDK